MVPICYLLGFNHVRRLEKMNFAINLGCQIGVQEQVQKKTHLTYTFGSSSLIWGPKNDFWVPIGAPFAVQILDKRHLGMNACTLGVPRRLQDELKTVQAFKIDPAWYQKCDVLNMSCPSCVQTCYHPAAFCRPLHSTDSIKARQNSN